MISTFDLFLLGSLISLGGLVFLLRAYRPQSTGSPLDIVFSVMRSRDTGLNETRLKAEAMAGVRWLTVGALALFLGYTGEATLDTSSISGPISCFTRPCFPAAGPPPHFELTGTERAKPRH
jgi:hypothetical protein